MNESKKQGEQFTPGPWEYSRRIDRPPYDYHVSQTGGGHIVTVHDEGGGYVHESNAALIAAAPELLAACKAALELLRDGDSDEYFDAAKLETMLEKAIERARGE